MSASMQRFILSLFVAVGIPAMILAGVFFSALVILFPISYFIGWI